MYQDMSYARRGPKGGDAQDVATVERRKRDEIENAEHNIDHQRKTSFTEMAQDK